MKEKWEEEVTMNEGKKDMVREKQVEEPERFGFALLDLYGS